ncbi:DNA breaking-rejoining enzyme [Gracilaria domingensis]|nr:DNA breaking-rejoining enzyme [Gracilaria domingensis]
MDDSVRRMETERAHKRPGSHDGLPRPPVGCLKSYHRGPAEGPIVQSWPRPALQAVRRSVDRTRFESSALPRPVRTESCGRTLALILREGNIATEEGAALAKWHNEMPEATSNEHGGGALAVGRSDKRQERLDKTDLLDSCQSREQSGKLNEQLLMSPEAFFQSHTLHARSLSKKTIKVYSKAFSQFQSDVSTPVADIEDIDVLLSNYTEDCFELNPLAGNKQKVSNIVCMLHIMVPQTKGRLLHTMRALKRWNKSLTTSPAYPLTEQLCFAMAARLLTQDMPEAAVALVVAWGAYLRVSEVLSLEYDLIASPGDERLADCPQGSAGVVIRETKTGLFQFVLIRNKVVLALFENFVRVNPTLKRTKLFKISYGKYENCLRQTAEFFGVTSVKITSHSARIGGALHDYLRGFSAQTIAITGRWKSLGSLRHYLTNGRSQLMLLKLCSTELDCVLRHKSWLVSRLAQNV